MTLKETAELVQVCCHIDSWHKDTLAGGFHIRYLRGDSKL